MKDYRCSVCGKVFKDLFPEELKECCGKIPNPLRCKVKVSHKTSTIYANEGCFDSWSSTHELVNEMSGVWNKEQEEDMVQKIFDDSALGDKVDGT